MNKIAKYKVGKYVYIYIKLRNLSKPGWYFGIEVMTDFYLFL